MSRKTYRICLVVIIAIAILTGVFYHQLYQKREIIPSEGTFVWQEMKESEWV